MAASTKSWMCMRPPLAEDPSLAGLGFSCWISSVLCSHIWHMICVWSCLMANGQEVEANEKERVGSSPSIWGPWCLTLQEVMDSVEYARWPWSRRDEASSSMPLVMPGTSVAHLITLSLDFHIHRKGIHVAQCYTDTQWGPSQGRLRIINYPCFSGGGKYLFSFTSTWHWGKIPPPPPAIIFFSITVGMPSLPWYFLHISECSREFLCVSLIEMRILAVGSAYRCLHGTAKCLGLDDLPWGDPGLHQSVPWELACKA